MTRFVGTPLRGIEFSSVSDEAISARVNGDGQPRIRIDAGGRITWSGGSAAGDTTLYRDAADLLTTDDVFKATGGLVTLATDGAPNQELPNGAVAIDTTNHVFYFRSNNTWNQVTGGGGASIEIGDTPPAAPETGDIWFESDTGSTFVYYDSFWVEIGSGAGEQGLPGEPGINGIDGVDGLGYGLEPYEGMEASYPVVFDEYFYTGYDFIVNGTIGAYKIGDRVKVTGSYDGSPATGAYVIGKILDFAFGFEGLYIRAEKWDANGYAEFVPENVSIIGLDGLGYGFEPYASMAFASPTEFALLTVGSTIEMAGTIGAYKIGDRVKITGLDGLTGDPAPEAYIIGTITNTIIIPESTSGPYAESVVVTVEKWNANGYEYLDTRNLSIAGEDGENGTDGAGYGFESYPGGPPITPYSFSALNIGDSIDVFGRIGAYKVGDRVRITDAIPDSYIIGTISSLNPTGDYLEFVSVIIEEVGNGYGNEDITLTKMSITGGGVGYAFELLDGQIPPTPYAFDEFAVGGQIDVFGRIGAYKVGDRVRISNPADYGSNAYVIGTIDSLDPRGGEFGNFSEPKVVVNVEEIFNPDNDYSIYFRQMSISGGSSSGSTSILQVQVFS